MIFFSFVDKHLRPVLYLFIKEDNRIPFKWGNYICLLVSLRVEVLDSSQNLWLLWKDRICIKPPVITPEPWLRAILQATESRQCGLLIHSPKSMPSPWAVRFLTCLMRLHPTDRIYPCLTLVTGEGRKCRLGDGKIYDTRKYQNVESFFWTFKNGRCPLWLSNSFF